MINALYITTEAELADVLAQCGYASETPPSRWIGWQAIWSHLPQMPPARHLLDPEKEGVFVAVHAGAFQIYHWIILAGKLRGPLTKQDLREKIALTASSGATPAAYCDGIE